VGILLPGPPKWVREKMGLPIAPFLRWWDGPKKFHGNPILTTEKPLILSTIPY